ncbi:MULTISPECIES: hypothetical protein [Streptomyces]|uniref:hypothetical protein n=1 Tax=Streptomyces TaxID=1883 RepID=UPI00069940E9|nr:DUF461 domain-containing protein [Streptomyces sp. SID7805]
MSRSLRRGVLAASALSLSIATLSACGAGNDAQTLDIKPDNAATAVGDIKVQNASVVTQPDPASKGPAAINVTVFNNGTKDQQLTAITVVGTGKSAKLAPSAAGAAGPITVPAGGSVVIGGQGNPSAVLPSSREAVQDGNAQILSFDFSATGKVELNAYVVPAKGAFESYGPTEQPSPSGTPSPGSSESGAPSGSGTPSGEASHTGH